MTQKPAKPRNRATAAKPGTHTTPAKPAKAAPAAKPAKPAEAATAGARATRATVAKPAKRATAAKQATRGQRPATSRAPRTSKRKPSHSEIAQRAYFIHLEDGGSDHIANWLRAERELATG